MAALAFGVCGLSACTVGPNFTRPAAPATTAYTAEPEAVAPEQRIALGRDIAGQWWTLFASQPLNDVIRQAITDNYSLAAAHETVAQAEQLVKSEAGGLYPQLGVSGQVGRQQYGVALFGPLNFSIPAFTYYEVGPTLSWTPDIFGAKRRAVERQRALAEYQTHELDAAYVTLTGNVVGQALEIAAAKAELDVALQIIQQDQETLHLVQAAFQAGSGTRVEILAAQSQLDTDRTLLPPIAQRLSVARHALSILVGKAPAEWAPPDFVLANFALPPDLPVSLPSELARRRPDILAAEANLHAASAAVGVAVANLYPKITLTANTMQEALTPGGLFDLGNNAWAMAAGLTAPLFSGGTLTAEKRAAEHAYQAALAEYHDTILRAFQDVADSLTGIAHDGEAAASQQQAVTTAEASLDLARRSYQAGNTGLLQIQEASRQLAQAQMALTRAQHLRLLDTARLFVALGGSPQPDAAAAAETTHAGQ